MNAISTAVLTYQALQLLLLKQLCVQVSKISELFAVFFISVTHLFKSIIKFRLIMKMLK